MKISPLAHNNGNLGQTLGSVDVGRTADPMKMERAKAIARGEKIPQEQIEAEKVRPNVRSIKMRTQVSTNREEPIPQALSPDAKETTEELSSSTLESNDAAATEATKPLSPQLAALNKMKREVQLAKQGLVAKETELAEREKALSGNSDVIARLKASPLSVLQEHGVSYDQLTEAILNEPNYNPEIDALKKELKELREGVDKSFQTREEAQEQAALTEMLYEAESLAKEGDTFEMIRAENAFEDVLRLIHTTYKQTGRVLDVSEAMDKVETKLLAKAEKLASLNKVRNRLQAPLTPQAQPSSQQKQMRTLTARDSAVPQMDRRARALAAFNGTLRK